MSQEEVLAPLPMTQLQTYYITKIMVRKSYVASSIVIVTSVTIRAKKSETMEHANNNRSSRYPTTLMILTMVTTIKMKVHTIVKSTKVVSCNTSSSDDNDDDDDSVSSMTTHDPPLVYY